jgi:hypothetical protein
MNRATASSACERDFRAGWIVTLCGGGGDYAPTTEAEWIAFARSLPSGEVYNLVRGADPAGPIVGYRRTENRWRHYEKLARRPAARASAAPRRRCRRARRRLRQTRGQTAAGAAA